MATFTVTGAIAADPIGAATPGEDSAKLEIVMEMFADTDSA